MGTTLQLERHADALRRARDTRTPIEPLTDTMPDLFGGTSCANKGAEYLEKIAAREKELEY